MMLTCSHVSEGSKTISANAKLQAIKRDWLKTIVAFANSTPDGSTGVLYIGVTNEGVIKDPSVPTSLRRV
jgi:predicted HTH transcriptional regulator